MRVTDSLFLRLKSLNVRTMRGVTTPKSVIRVAAMHNLREIQAELGATATSGIDPSRMALNYQLRGPATAAGVADLALALLDNAGVKNLRRDACMALELVFSLPPAAGIDHREYFAAAVAWADSYFNAPILSAAVHLDEAAPHCHVLVLPLVAGRMNGGALAGGPSKIRMMQSDFHQQVGQRFGLTHQPRARRLSSAHMNAAGRMVLETLQAHPERLTDSILRNALAAALGQHHETLLPLLGLALQASIKPAAKVKTKSFVSIMTASKPERKTRTRKSIDVANAKSIDVEVNSAGARAPKIRQRLCSVDVGPAHAAFSPSTSPSGTSKSGIAQHSGIIQPASDIASDRNAIPAPATKLRDAGPVATAPAKGATAKRQAKTTSPDKLASTAAPKPQRTATTPTAQHLVASIEPQATQLCPKSDEGDICSAGPADQVTTSIPSPQNIRDARAPATAARKRARSTTASTSPVPGKRTAATPVSASAAPRTSKSKPAAHTSASTATAPRLASALPSGGKSEPKKPRNDIDAHQVDDNRRLGHAVRLSTPRTRPTGTPVAVNTGISRHYVTVDQPDEIRTVAQSMPAKSSGATTSAATEDELTFERISTAPGAGQSAEFSAHLQVDQQAGHRADENGRHAAPAPGQHAIPPARTDSSATAQQTALARGEEPRRREVMAEAEHAASGQGPLQGGASTLPQGRLVARVPSAADLRPLEGEQLPDDKGDRYQRHRDDDQPAEHWDADRGEFVTAPRSSAQPARGHAPSNATSMLQASPMATRKAVDAALASILAMRGAG